MLICTATLQTLLPAVVGESILTTVPCMDEWDAMCVDSNSYDVYDNSCENIGTVPAYQAIYKRFKDPIICYLHTDVTIHERGWDRRIAREFDDPKVAIVGMGGALGIGTPDLYRRPYRIEQLIRRDYRSNQSDWQVHGVQEQGACDVAVVDGFCIAVRRSFLDQIRGWSWFPYTFHCYDTALCCMARRYGWKVRMVGVSCTHHGGGGSTSQQYRDWCEKHGTTLEREHREPHKWMWREFKDVLPFTVEGE